MCRLGKWGCALCVAGMLFSYAMDRNFMENEEVLAQELEEFEETVDIARLVPETDPMSWYYKLMEKRFLRGQSPEAKKYEVALAVNADVIGYIRIPESRVDYPIVYSGDNEYYLARNVSGEADAHGAIYLDAFSHGVWGRVNLVHGHSMLDGTMFKDVLKYVSQEWYEAHKDIKVFDGKEDRVYEVFAVYILDSSKENIQLYYEDENAFVNWLIEIIDRSIVRGGVVRDREDLLVLNTCSYQFSGAHTIVVASRREDGSSVG